MKVMMEISYDGSKFYGFQRQKVLPNVQGYLEKSLQTILKEEIVVKGAGRTDAKVHAKGQVVHFETNKDIKNLKKDLNNYLENVRVKKVKRVDEAFHARHSVLNKIYLYKLDLSGKRDHSYYGYVKNKLDIKKIKEASKLFLGTHDFHNFVSGERDNYYSTIFKVKIYKFNNVLYFKFKGIAFYRYMVRNLVGALIDVGKGKAHYNDIEEMLNNPLKDKRLETAMPSGLYLVKINY